MEPDYSIHLQRAEKALQAIYPKMCDRKVAEGMELAQEAIREITAYASWVLAHSVKK